MTFQEFGKNIAVMRYDEPSNLLDLFETSAKKYPTSKYIGEKNTEGIYKWNTYQEIAARVDNLRGGLASLRVLEKGDRVGIIANNRTEWAICAYATYGLECSWVPMYEKELFQTWKYIIRDSCIKILFVSTHAIYNEVKGLTEKIPTLKKIFVIESDAEHSMMALEAIGNGHPVKSKKPVHSDTAILIQQKDVQNLISKEIRAHLKGTFGGYEIPRKLLFLAEDFTLANGMLTQTLKLKRRNILKKYGAQIESLYDEGIQ